VACEAFADAHTNAGSVMANPFHGFDPYRADKDQAARERAEWRKAFPRTGPRQEGPLWRGALGKRKLRPVTLAKGA
jgi:hypothetical protein